MYLARNIEEKLLDWKNDPKKKPMIIRGARQVGKTETITHFGQSHFEHFVAINFEKQKRIHSLFSGDLEPRQIIQDLEAITNQQIIPGKTLLFFDEIQSCPEAIKSLRYFFEEIPKLHLIAAGSLLEFALGEVSIPLGRVTYEHMYPLSFTEFLSATHQDKLITHIPTLQDKPQHSSPAVFEKLYSALRSYFIVGGMPEAVSSYCESLSYIAVQKIHDDLIQSLIDDIPKYTQGNLQESNIENVFSNLFNFVGKQVKYSKLVTGDNSARTKKSLQLLEKALLCHTVKSVNPAGLPLNAEASEKFFKVLFLDIGLGNRLAGIEPKSIIEKGNLLDAYEGRLAEQFVGQQLIAESHLGSEKRNLYCWIRQAKSSNAEVDYIIARNSKAIPVEVKSGKSGRLKSLHLLLEKYPNIEKAVVLQHTCDIHSLDKVQILPLFSIL